MICKGTMNLLSINPIYAKDKDGKKTTTISSYAVKLLELARDKEDKVYPIIDDFFISGSSVKPEEISKLKMFDVVDLEFEIAHINSEKRIVSIQKTSIELTKDVVIPVGLYVPKK